MPNTKWTVLLALAGLTGCGNPFSGTECTTIAIPALSVTVVDSLTGRNLAPEATVWVREGTFVDTLRAWPGSVVPAYKGPMERAGTYAVVATHAGYLEWRQTGVRVREDECHVKTREITARLIPRP